MQDILELELVELQAEFGMRDMLWSLCKGLRHALLVDEAPGPDGYGGARWLRASVPLPTWVIGHGSCRHERNQLNWLPLGPDLMYRCHTRFGFQTTGVAYADVVPVHAGDGRQVILMRVGWTEACLDLIFDALQSGYIWPDSHRNLGCPKGASGMAAHPMPSLEMLPMLLADTDQLM